VDKRGGVLQMQTSALFDTKNSGFFEIFGVSARTRGSIFRDFVWTSFMDGPNTIGKIHKITDLNWPDRTSGKMSATGEEGIGFNPELIKPPTHCQRLATAANLKVSPGTKPQKWAPLTRDTRKDIK